MQQPNYPDVSEIFARKERGRLAQARLSFADKLDLLDRLHNNEKSLGEAMREATRRAAQAEKA